MNATKIVLNAKEFGIEDAEEMAKRIETACDVMEQNYRDGCYSRISVHRTWSQHNPVIQGKVARPSAIRWYLLRELSKLLKKGAEITITQSRARVDLQDPSLLERIDESEFDHTKKKVFLFGPERVELSMKRLEHYTGTQVESFQRYILLTNYHMHTEVFQSMHPDCVGPNRPDVQMPAYHACRPHNSGISIVNIGVGPSNAKNFTDHLAVLRPDAMLMVGHCAGIRNHQSIGDFVLASGYMRDDHVLDVALPRSVPVMPSFLLNRYLAKVLEEHQLKYRLGSVYTTADRNWELALSRKLNDLKQSRSIGVDMESATVAANGFRYRIPSATLLCISDKPLHGAPKLPNAANAFYEKSKQLHLELAEAALRLVHQEHPDGLPNADLRAMDEPLLEGPEM